MDNIPAAQLDQMGKDLQQVELDRTLTRLTDAMGKCERIKNNVFPSTYSLYIHLSLMLFIALLPFGVIDENKPTGTLLCRKRMNATKDTNSEKKQRMPG